MARKITVEIDIDPWDVLGEVSTTDLKTELISRSQIADDREELREVIRQANDETALRLERIFFPKFTSSEGAREAYQRAMQEKAA